MVEEAASPLFLLGRCLEVAFKSPVTSHSFDKRGVDRLTYVA